jgi:hypothetical protein
MSWKKERDALIAQTLAFVQSVARRKDGVAESANKADAEPEIAAAAFDALKIDALKIMELPAIVEPLKTAGPPKSIQILPANAASEFRVEIQTRVANFRAHQERFNRERADYFSATLAKARAAIDDDFAPSR